MADFSPTKLHLIMFLGRAPFENVSAEEREFDGVVMRAARATLKAARAADRFDRLLIVTSEAAFVAPDGVEVRRIPPQANFHLGQALAEIVAEVPPNDRIVYVGGGAGSLLTQAEWYALADVLAGPEDEVVTANNYFSADLVGWKPAHALHRLAELPADDNNLAYLLCRKAGLPWHNWLAAGAARTIGTQFDYDTPTDAAIARSWLLQRNDTGELASYLTTCHTLNRIPVVGVLAELGRVEGQVLVAGRISGTLHRELERLSHSQTRVISEERGLRASGREARGQAVSLLGFLLDELGPTRFFEKLADTASAAILDSRVLFAHQKILNLSRADRFASDALQPDDITNPAIRALTEAALEVHTRRAFPILLGGHSAVAGGLMLLLDQLPPRYKD